MPSPLGERARIEGTAYPLSLSQLTFDVHIYLPIYILKTLILFDRENTLRCAATTPLSRVRIFTSHGNLKLYCQAIVHWMIFKSVTVTRHPSVRLPIPPPRYDSPQSSDSCVPTPCGYSMPRRSLLHTSLL